MAAGDQAMAEALRGQLNSSFDRDGAKVAIRAASGRRL